MTEPPPRVARTNGVTAAIAHELNNVLTVVRTYTHFARQPSTQEQSARDLRVVAAAAERASALVDWFASNGEAAPRAEDEVSANAFVSTVSTRLEQLIQAGTSLEIMRVSTDVTFRANALRLEHVVMSLVLAASQRWAETAFKFSIERASGTAEQHPELGAGEHAVLMITCLDATKKSDWRARLVSPRDQVSALLAPLDDLLGTMNGKLESSRTGEGEERFRIYLPTVSPASRTFEPRPALLPPSASTVCVIENETAIRLAMLRALSGAGHFVVEANDSVAARELVIVHGRAVRLIVCDAGLVHDGQEFFAWTKATCPNAALLLISGNEQAGAAKASSLRARFLAKPFTPTELVSAARQTLVQAAAAARASGSVEPLVVLVVDDEQVVRDSFERLLAECDFETIVASSGSHALQILSERHVDALVSDQFMPGLGGIDLLELVRERFPACVRILCTAHPAAGVVISAIDQGRIHRVLPKTMHPVALRDEIERAVREGYPPVGPS